MDLKDKLKTGALTGLMALAGLTGCANTPEARQKRDALMEQMIFQGAAAELRKKGENENAQAMENIGNVMGSIRAQKAGRSEVNVYGGRGESRGNYNGRGISLQTPLGYTVYLDKYSEIMYNGERHLVQEINPPNIGVFKVYPTNTNKIGTFWMSRGYDNIKHYQDFGHIEISMMSDNEFTLDRKKDALMVGRAIAANGKIYFDPEERKNEWRYYTIPINELDMFKE